MPDRPIQLDPPVAGAPVAVLLSGGLDSAVLFAQLARQQIVVQPVYVRSHLRWEAAELAAVRQWLARLASPWVRPLVVLEMPVADLYGEHWSLCGDVPDADTPDEAVYLPGRNLLLVAKPALYCQMHDIPQLALAPLVSNPFPDATDRYFAALETMLELGGNRPLRIWRPFADWHKVDVMRLGRDFPLELSFSCINPVGGQHCGACNKCQERRLAFSQADINDPTQYAAPSHCPIKSHPE